MPHVPLFRSEKFKDKSGAGVYGDVMMEIDWSVGEITKALMSAGVEDNTLVIMTSDNGPWISYGNHAGQDPLSRGQGNRIRWRHSQRLHHAISWTDQSRLGLEEGALLGDLLPTSPTWRAPRCRKTRSTAGTCGISSPENAAR